MMLKGYKNQTMSSIWHHHRSNWDADSNILSVSLTCFINLIYAGVSPLKRKDNKL